MVERKAINAKDINQVLNVDNSGKTGYWKRLVGIAIRRQCSECNAMLAHNTPYYNFCANCGAKMVERREDEINEQ